MHSLLNPILQPMAPDQSPETTNQSHKTYTKGSPHLAAQPSHESIVRIPYDTYVVSVLGLNKDARSAYPANTAGL